MSSKKSSIQIRRGRERSSYSVFFNSRFAGMVSKAGPGEWSFDPCGGDLTAIWAGTKSAVVAELRRSADAFNLNGLIK